VVCHHIIITIIIIIIIIIITGFSVYLHNSSIIRACIKQKSFELSFKTGSVSDGLNMIS